MADRGKATRRIERRVRDLAKDRGKGVGGLACDIHTVIFKDRLRGEREEKVERARAIRKIAQECRERGRAPGDRMDPLRSASR